MNASRGRHRLIGATVIAATASVLSLSSVAETKAPKEKCFGKVPTLTGGANANTLNGTDGITPPKHDVIVGRGGADIMTGDPEDSGGERDYICGGTGKDEISGRDKEDFLRGDEGSDFINGGTGLFGDEIKGDEGNDTLNGGSGDDVIKGGAGDDTIDLGAGNSSGPDTVSAGSGDDTIDQSDSGAVDTVNCGPGTDTITADAGVDTLSNCENVTLE